MRDPTVIAVVPAHNEEEQIGDCLHSLLAQTRSPDQILVILDNCTDRTKEIVREFPVDATATVGNRNRKAGALNQAFARCQEFDYLVSMDADSVLDPRFIENAIQEMEGSEQIGAVSGRYAIKDFGRLPLRRRIIHAVVQHEICFWDTLRMGNPGDALLACGAGSMFRVEALRQVGGWDIASLTEDNALSLDLRLARWRIVVGKRCYLYADTPLDFRLLWRQRVRWSRGVEDYKRRPLGRATYKGRLTNVYSWLILLWWVALVAVDITYRESFNPLWLLPLAGLYLERLWRFRFFPRVGVSNFILALPICEFFMILLWRSATIVGIYRRARHVEQW
ncbi:MAG: hypothetical protein DLM66_00050 [Candidatus Dormiibacter spiritus]|nr:MAG: hypothetical protein DLM66_00050 [Candidatus Dormibacteraeota bacterium]